MLQTRKHRNKLHKKREVLSFYFKTKKVLGGTMFMIKLTKAYAGCTGCFFFGGTHLNCGRRKEERKCEQGKFFYIYVLIPKRF